jgi:hypothetical protein
MFNRINTTGKVKEGTAQIYAGFIPVILKTLITYETAIPTRELMP